MQETGSGIGAGAVAAVFCLFLSACQPAPLPGGGSAPPEARITLIPDRDGKPPKGPEGACWQDVTTPAVIETETVQVLITPETRDAAGQVITPAVYGSQTHQRMVRDRARVWFRAPCPEEMTVGYIASLQRALKARGYFLGEVTGEVDASLQDAVRRFQAERGLDSAALSLQAAQELGISAVAAGG